MPHPGAVGSRRLAGFYYAGSMLILSSFPVAVITLPAMKQFPFGVAVNNGYGDLSWLNQK